MCAVVYILSLAGPSALTRNIQQERLREIQFANPTEGMANNTEIACITYWMLGCPTLRGPYFPTKLEVAGDTKEGVQSPRVGLLRYILNPLPGYYDADQILINLQTILSSKPLDADNLRQHWFLFRIFDEQWQAQVIAKLESYQQDYTVVPFDMKVYANIPYTFHYFDHYKNDRDVVHNKWYQTHFYPAKKAAVLGSAIRDKSLYVYNRNAVRNLMLEWAEVEWGNSVDWWIPLDPDVVWTATVHRSVTRSLSYAKDNVNYVVLPMVQQSTPHEAMDALHPWRTTPLDLEATGHANPYDQTSKLLHHTPSDGYQLVLRQGAVGRFHPYLPMGRYDTEEFLSRLRSVDGYGWWNVTTEGTWLPWEMDLLAKTPSPDADMHPTEDRYETATMAHENDPWRLSLQLAPSDATTAAATAMVDALVVRLYTNRAVLLAPHDVLNYTYFDQQYLVESMARAFPPMNYQAALQLNNISTSFKNSTIANRLFYFDRSMLKYEQSTYQKAQFQSLDEMPNRIQSLVWMVHKLVETARESHRNEPWSVVDKPKEYVAPSGNPRDYYNVAPHFLPPILDDGTLGYTLPYEKKGWGPIPNQLYGPKSDRNDLSRFTSMAYNVTVLSLASFFTGQELFAQYGVKLLKHWFWDEDASMTPHMRFASVRWNWNETDWEGEHITDLQSLYFLLDAVHLMEEGGHMRARQIKLFRQWMQAFLDWLETDLQGTFASSIEGPQGLYFDIMCASIAFYLNDEAKTLYYIQWATSRMRAHFNEKYEMGIELSKSHCEDGQMQGLLAWHTLARMADHVGFDLWAHSVSDFDPTKELAEQVYLPDDPLYNPKSLQGVSTLCAASARAIPYVLNRPPCKGDLHHNRLQNLQRWWPLLDGYRRACVDWPVENLRGVDWATTPLGSSVQPPSTRYQMPFLFPHEENIPPFWNFGYRIKGKA